MSHICDIGLRGEIVEKLCVSCIRDNGPQRVKKNVTICKG